jgi:hypothetical protein
MVMPRGVYFDKSGRDAAPTLDHLADRKRERVFWSVALALIVGVGAAYLFTHDVDVDFGVRAKRKGEAWKPRVVATVAIPRPWSQDKPVNARGIAWRASDKTVWYRDFDYFEVTDENTEFVVPDRYLRPDTNINSVFSKDTK